MRPWSKVALGLAGAAVLGSAAMAASLEPMVRSRIAARAEGLGLEVSVGSVDAGWFRVHLGNVKVSPVGVRSVGAHLGHVRVDIGAALNVRRVTVEGGEITVDGTPDLVGEQVDAWRASRPKADAANESATGSGRVEVKGVHVVWKDAFEGSAPIHVWGSSYRRDGDSEFLGADLVRAAHGGASFDVHGAEAEVRRGADGRELERVRASEATIRIRLDSSPIELLSDPTAQEAPGPGSERAPESGRPPKGGVAATHPGKRIRAAFRKLARAASLGLAPGSVVELDGLRVEIRHGEQSLNVGPGQLKVSRQLESVEMGFVPGSGEQETPLEANLEVPIGDGPVSVRVGGGPVSLAALGVREGDMGLMKVPEASIAAELDAKLAADGTTVAVAGEGTLKDVAVQQEWIAGQPVSGIELGWRGSGDLALDGSHIAVESLELRLGQVKATLSGALDRVGDEFSLRLKGGVPLAACQQMVESLPAGLAPLLTGVRMAGTFSIDGELEVDTRALGKMKVSSTTSNECRVTAVPEPISPARFQSPFSRQVVGADGVPTAHTSGPGAPGWVPLSNVSHHMETAVLICEDGRFFRHQGFDEEAIHNSIRENVKQRSFVRGASTISMQLAKNLYLKREKTLSRKLQETVLTMLLEQSLSKRQMMELYLNVIEYGPGIYGIGPAARHYFGTHPAALTLGQSLYMASILPNPRQQHFAAGGQVTGGWANYLRKLMKIAHRIHRIDDEELDYAVREIVTYQMAESPRLPPEAGEFPADVIDDGALFGSPRQRFEPGEL